MPRLVEGGLFSYNTVQANLDNLPNRRLDTDGEAPPVGRTAAAGANRWGAKPNA